MDKNKQIIMFNVLLLFVVLFCIAGCGSLMNEPGMDDIVRYSPDNLWIASISEQAVQIGWSAFTGNTEKVMYVVERTILNQSLHKIDSTTNTYFIDSSVDPSKTYCYRVWAVQGSRTSYHSWTLTINYGASYTLLRTVQSNIGQCILNHDGNFLATACNGDKFIHIWNTSDWSSTKFDIGFNGGAYDVIAMTQNSQFIVVGGLSTIRIYQRSDGSLIRTIASNPDYITDLALTPRGDILASVDIKGRVQLWNLNDGTHIHLLDSVGFSTSRGSLGINPHDTSLVVCSDSNLRVWNLRDFSLIKQLDGYFYYPVFNSNGSILSVFDRGLLKWYSTNNWTCLYSNSFPGTSHNPIAFSPADDIQLIGDLNIIRVARVSDGEKVGTICCQEVVSYIAFFPDGKTFISTTGNKIFIWSTELTNQWVVSG
jgi:WD40 repeat protein